MDTWILIADDVNIFLRMWEGEAILNIPDHLFPMFKKLVIVNCSVDLNLRINQKSAYLLI
jgi:hypothetical protein